MRSSISGFSSFAFSQDRDFSHAMKEASFSESLFASICKFQKLRQHEATYLRTNLAEKPGSGSMFLKGERKWFEDERSFTQLARDNDLAGP